MSALFEYPALKLKITPLEGRSEELIRLSDTFERQGPQSVLEWALAEFGDKIALATGFGPEGMALLDMSVKLKKDLNVFFVDTDVLFPETHELRERVERKYGLKIAAYRPALTLSEQADLHGGELWKSNPDLCCRLRKLDPLKEALNGLKAWITAIRRDQSHARAQAGIVEWDNKWRLIKLNPLANWTKRQVWDYILRHDVPYNPLHDVGYPSIGCTHCTQPVRLGEDDRAGRWRGFAKTECGLHC